MAAWLWLPRGHSGERGDGATHSHTSLTPSFSSLVYTLPGHAWMSCTLLLCRMELFWEPYIFFKCSVTLTMSLFVHFAMVSVCYLCLFWEKMLVICCGSAQSGVKWIALLKGVSMEKRLNALVTGYIKILNMPIHTVSLQVQCRHSLKYQYQIFSG